jgi:CspA family cold shock protein
VPTGKVKWYDAEKGFGFLSDDEGGDVFLHANALPEGVTTLKGGTRVEFGIVEGRRGAQALSVRLLEPAPSVSAGRRERDRRKPEEMTVIVEDAIKLLDGVSNDYHRGRWPDHKHASAIAKALRGIADELDAG